MTPVCHLEYYRRRAGLTQEKLAKKIFSHKGHISELENEKYFPNLITAYRISKVLNVPILDIWRIEDDRPSSNQ